MCECVCVFKQYAGSLGFMHICQETSAWCQALNGLEGGIQLWDYCHRWVSGDLKERGWAMNPVSEAGGPAHFLSKLPFQAVSVLVEEASGTPGM